MNRYGTKRYSTSLSIVVATSATTVTSGTLALNGILTGIAVNCPALDSSATLTVTVKDSDGYTIYSKSTISANQKTSLFVDANNYPLQLPLSGSCTVTLTASASQATDKAIPVVLYYQTT